MNILVKFFFFIFVGCFSIVCIGNEKKRYVGNWTAWSTYGMATFHTFRIDEESISWAGHRDISPECKSRYEVVEHNVLESHPDVPKNIVRSKEVEKIMYSFYKIKLLESECSPFESMLLPFPITNEFRTDNIYHTYFIGYRKDGRKEQISVDVSE